MTGRQPEQTHRTFSSPADVLAHWSRLCEAEVVQLADLNLFLTWVVTGEQGGKWLISCAEAVRFEELSNAAESTGRGSIGAGSEMHEATDFGSTGTGPTQGEPVSDLYTGNFQERDDFDQVDSPARCVVELNTENFLGLASGALNPQQMFLDRRMRVAGSLSGALRVNTVLRRLLDASRVRFDAHADEV